MYLIGHHGNNLYTSSLRLFTEIELVFQYMEEKRKEAIAEYKGTKHQEHIDRITKDLPTYIKHMGYKYFCLEPNNNKDTETIRKDKIAKLAAEWLKGHETT